MLHVNLSGNLGSDAEVRYSQDGNPLCQFNVAVNSRRKDRDGQFADKTNWFRCKISGKRGEAISQYLLKGTKVFVIGRLDIRDFTREDNTPGVSYDVWVDEVEFNSPRVERNDDDEYERAPSRPTSRPPAAAAAAPRRNVLDEEDLPF